MDGAKKYDYVYASPDRYPILREFQKHNRQHPTHAEKILWLQLRIQLGEAKFRQQYIIGDYIVDFVSLKNHLIIEVDGAYHSERQQQEDDLLRENCLKKIGFNVIRFKNEEIVMNVDLIIKRIKEEIK